MTPEPEWVDLGLPSGLLWRRFNLGATKPESFGLYFSWGNTEGHPSGAGYNFSQEVYNTTPATAISADLSLEQDAASVNLGAPWRMPTNADFQELVSNCAHVWTTLNGVHGCLFTSNVNGNTLFFPAAGYYTGTTLNGREESGYCWSSTYNSAADARVMGFYSTNVVPGNLAPRRNGYTIRAVRPA